MTTVFLIISKDVIRRNIYDTGFWQLFLDDTQGVQKVLIVPPENIETTIKLFGGDSVVVEGYQKVSWRGLDKFIMFLVRTGVDSHSTLLYRKRAYKRKKAGLLQSLGKGFVARTLGNFGIGQHLVRLAVSRLSTSKTLRDLYNKYEPTAVFAPSLIDTDFDVPVSIEARKRKIKVIGMIRSWDNLNNHGILPFIPDVFILQNKWLKEAAMKFQGLKESDFCEEMSGLPHYDHYKNFDTYIKPRTEFMEAFGLDPEKRFVLLGGSDFYYSEDSLPRILNDAIENGSIEKPLQVVFRPHPSSMFSKDDYGLTLLPHVILDDAFSGAQKFSDTEKFMNLVYHADIVINTASTLSIDAAVFDTPTIGINFDDSEKNLSYFEEVHRLYDTFDHYERLVATKGIRTPDSKEKLIKDINEYLEDGMLDAKGRREIIDTFVAPFDGNSGKKLAKIVAQHIAV